MATWNIFVESPSGSGTFSAVQNGLIYDDGAGYVGQYLTALMQQSGQSFIARMITGTAATPPANAGAPSLSNLTQANASFASGLSVNLGSPLVTGSDSAAIILPDSTVLTLG